MANRHQPSLNGSEFVTNFYIYENIRMAYGHPRSRSCGGLEGPFGPCWDSFPEFKIDPAI